MKAWPVAVIVMCAAGACGHSGEASAGPPGEVKANLRAIYNGAKVYYETEHDPPGALSPITLMLPGPSAGPTPPTGTCCKAATKKCAPDASLWNTPTWRALAFSINVPHVYSYRYEVHPSFFVAKAIGTPNCDGNEVAYAIRGQLEDGQLAPVRDAQIVAVDPLE